MKFFYENRSPDIQFSYGTSLGFDAHLHSHIELVYLFDGYSRAFVDSEEYVIKGGDIFLVFSNQIHQYQNMGLEHHILCIFPPEICPEFLPLFQNKVPVSPVISGGTSNPRILPLLEGISQAMNAGTFQQERIRGYFLLLLSELFDMLELTETSAKKSNTIGDVLTYCSQHYLEDLSLEQVAQMLHLSKYYLSHLFRQKMHMTFADYISSLRISDACRMLRMSDLPITEIAFRCGFSSPRSFNRAFSKYTQTTPREYRRQGFTPLDPKRLRQ
ncbi:MAG: AraC family transcriptional regulator [Massiliimalia sp.]|jgi:AraC-like DNA-binding protein